MATVIDEIRTYLEDEVIEADSGIPITDDTPIWDEELIDSMGIMMLIAHIEDEYSVDIDAEDVAVDHFKSVRAIAALIEAKRS